MLKELILRCPNDFSGGLTTFQSLVKMQHYSLPTRLLDLTSNPLVALYFACTSHGDNDEDGEVIVLGFDISQVKYFDSDTVSVIANLSRRPSSFKVPEEADTKTFNGDAEIELLLHDVRQDKPYFEPKIRRDDLRRVICVKPKLDNPRIIRQDGAFLLFGVDGDKTRAATLGKDSVVDRIKINRDKKKEILAQLGALGISKATLFPEIEQVATHIKETYRAPELSSKKMGALEARALDVLSKDSPASVRTVASELDIMPQSASRVISRLYEMGAIERLGSGRSVRWQVKTNVRLSD